MTNTATAAATLSPGTLALAVADCVMRGLDVTETCAALPREDPEKVSEKHQTIVRSRGLGAHGGDDCGRCEGSPRQRRVRTLPTRNRHGLTLAEIAARFGVERATLKAALIHHGYLEEAPFGGHQRRAVVTEAAFRAGVGHTADGSKNNSPTLGGWERACPFPVFYEDRIDDIMWTLGLDRIAETCTSMGRKQDRLAWLLAHHRHLPNAELMRLSGMSLRSVEAAAAKARTVRAAAP